MMPDNYDWEAAWTKPDRPAANVLPHPTITNGSGSAYGVKALAAELETLANTGEGSRNHQLNVSAYNLAQLVAAGHLDSPSTYQQLRTTALAIGLTAQETDATLRSAFLAGQQTPRIVPEKPSLNVLEVPTINPKTGELMQPAPEQQTAIDRRQLQIESLYIDHDGLAHIKPPEPIIEGWLYQNSLAWLAGKPGDGKSFIALDMAYSVATGHAWQGHTTTQGQVLYIAAEGASGLSIRANAWCMANGTPTDIPITYLPLAVRLTNPAEIDVLALLQALQALEPSLIIIDTQARVTTGAEENSAKDMGWFIDALETLRRAHPATYLTVHHTPRNGDNLRGSIALEGAAETVLLSVKDGEVVTLKCQKQKNAAPADDLAMYMQPIGDSVVMSVEGVEVSAKITKIMEELLRALVEGFRREASAAELRDYVKLKDGGSFSRPVTDLVNAGLITTRKDGRARYYEATPKGHLQILRMSPQPPGGSGIHSSTPPPPFKGGGVGGIPTSGDTEDPTTDQKGRP